MLSLFTVKKILFFGTLGTGIIGPIVATSPIIREFGKSSDISPLKADLTNWNSADIYDGESISSFLQKSLIYSEGQDGLIESFSQELAKRWYFSQPDIWTEQQKGDWKKLQEKQFQESWKDIKPINPQRDYWDNYWGSRESMDSFWLRHNSYKLVKSFLTEFNKTDFTFNKSFDSNKKYVSSEELNALFSNSSFLKEKELESPNNWDKIGFFPSKAQSVNQNEEWKKFIWGKYEFINWSYQKWFNKTLPAYFWKISWFYNRDATTKDLEAQYNRATLKNNFPSKASYSFPIFSTKTNKIFKEFINKISETSKGGKGDTNVKNLNFEEQFIEGWYGEQASPATLIDTLNSFDNSSPELASAVSYLLNKVIEGAPQQPKSSIKINELKLNNGKTKNLENPISIFFANGQQQNDLISFNSEILIKPEEKKNKHIYDLRETDTNWIFFRDNEGVHALTLDGYSYLLENNFTNTSIKPENKLFHWFNFRNFQSTRIQKNWITSKKFLLLEESNDWFSRFTNYLTQNFDRFFSEYYVTKGEESLLFRPLKDKKYFNNYREALSKLFALKETQELNSKLFNLRKKIIEKYSSREWTNKNNLQAEQNQGLSSSFPYKINLDVGETTRFPNQENIFNKFLGLSGIHNTVNKVDSSDSILPKTIENQNSNYTQLLIDYSKSINNLIENKDINLKIRSNGFNFQSSQRLFIFDSIFDYLLDKLFANKDLLNYQIKEKKLLNSDLFSKNELLKEKQENSENNLPWVAPINIENKIFNQLNNEIIKVSSTNILPEDTQHWDCNTFSSKESKSKKNLHSLLNQLLKIYFFRTYLKTLNENYFNFLIGFPKGAPNNQNLPSQQTSSSSFSFLTDDLFKQWRETYITNVKEKDKFLNFLITLNFLSKNHFEKLREALQVELASNTKYHYLLFESVLENKDSQDNKKEIHPFLSNNPKSKESFFKNRHEARRFIRENWKTKGKFRGPATHQTKEFIFKNLLTEQSLLPNEKKNLFNFTDLKGLIVAITNITNSSDFENLVSLLSKIDKTINSDFYKTEKIFTKGHKEKKIYLEDKKKLLIYQLLNIDKGSWYSSREFTMQEENDIFKKSLNQLIDEFNLPETKSTQLIKQSKKYLDEKFFNRERGVIEEKFYIQISAKDFENNSSLCHFFNQLPIELLAEFLIHQTDKPLNKEKAQNNFFDLTYRIKPRDMKFKTHIDTKHLE